MTAPHDGCCNPQDCEQYEYYAKDENRQPVGPGRRRTVRSLVDMNKWPKSRLGRALEFLDNWHHDKKVPGTWIFCDLWEWWVTAGDDDHRRMIVRERLHKLGFGPDPYKKA